jgi:hypothetical protein
LERGGARAAAAWDLREQQAFVERWGRRWIAPGMKSWRLKRPRRVYGGLVWLGERKGERGGARTQAQISTSWVRVGREATEEQRRETMMIREDRRDSLSPLQKVVTSVVTSRLLSHTPPPPPPIPRLFAMAGLLSAGPDRRVNASGVAVAGPLRRCHLTSQGNKTRDGAGNAQQQLAVPVRHGGDRRSRVRAPPLDLRSCSLGPLCHVPREVGVRAYFMCGVWVDWSTTTATARHVQQCHLWDSH